MNTEDWRFPTGSLLGAIALAVLGGAALASGFATGASLPTLAYAQSATQSPVPAMPGRLVATDAGHRLHLWCTGEGSPTVILVAGLGAYSVDWGLVQPAVAVHSRVCSYDRAGYAWSEKGPAPRGVGVSAAELHQLLRRADVRPPYVMVGHSWGGLIARVFAHAYPDEVAGMVLVDTPSSGGTATVSEDVLSSLDPRAEEESNPAAHLPADLRAARIWARNLPGQQSGHVTVGGMPVHSSTQNLSQETSDLAEPGRAIKMTTTANKVALGDKPLFVVSAGRLSWDAQAHASGRSYLKELRGHIANQAYSAGLSRNSQFRVARASFHSVHLYEPQIVTNAILRVLASARTGAPLARLPWEV